MSVTKSKIRKNLEQISENIAAACDRSKRQLEEVRIIAVTKTVGSPEIKSLLDLGVRDFGESRAKQLYDRATELNGYFQRSRNSDISADHVNWHMIGHLQRNKVKAVLEVADVVHSIDSLRLAEELNLRAERMGRVVDVMMQVNCSQEPQKFGVPVGAATHLGDMICTMKNLRLVGLMTMAELVEDPEKARPAFVRLRELFDEMKKEKIGGTAFGHLSMGMSNDYQVAVEEGATLLRIGTALFE